MVVEGEIPRVWAKGSSHRPPLLSLIGGSVMITLFTGPGPFAQMVRDELLERGVGADLRSEAPLGQLYGSAGSPVGLQSVVVPEEIAERHRGAIDEVLAMVSEVAAEPEAES
jgi:hypothetical protein